MKHKIITLLMFISTFNIVFAQNVGIGTADPYNKLHVAGNLVVTTPTTATTATPTPAQIKTMVNGTNIAFLSSEVTGRIYDPGGPGGNYLPNLNASATVGGALVSFMAFEITAETMDLGTGDSLIFKETLTSTENLLAVGNGYNATGKWVFNSPTLAILFKSNADANTGAGFSLLFKALYSNSSSLPNIGGATGISLLFDTKNGWFKCGKINNSKPGFCSVVMGENTTASGNFSIAMGHNSRARRDYSRAMGDDADASGYNSTAIGLHTTASGDNSSAIGSQTTASGDFSTAIGFYTVASGDQSTAIGFSTTASGDNSTAMGSYVSTNGQEGSFVIGDNSASTDMNSPAPNNFRARFANGYRLYTSANLSTSCSVGAGDNAWTTGSSVHTKENFAPVNGEDFLQKISRFNLTSWNYKTQDPKTFRHYGPMAQDFYAAFGKDVYGTIGNDTTINSADFAGVSFIAIQALEKRTQKIGLLEQDKNWQSARLDDVETKLQEQQTIIESQQKQIDELKTMLNKMLKQNPSK